MLLDRRKRLVDRRRPHKRSAKIKYYPGSLPRDCVITDISERSVNVVVEDDDIPAQFALIFSTGHSTLCRLQWRKGHELGAEFIDRVGRRRRRRRPLAK
jgi:hypothetical protein